MRAPKRVGAPNRGIQGGLDPALGQTSLSLSADILYGHTKINGNLSFLVQLAVAFVKSKVLSCLRVKKDDFLFVNSALWARIRSEILLNIGPNPGRKHP